MFKEIIKKSSTKTVIEQQKKVQKNAKLKRKEREAVYDLKQKRKGNRVITWIYPMMVDYYASAGEMFKPLIGILLIYMVGLFVYFIGLSIHDSGLEATLKDFIAMGQEIQWNHILFIVMAVLFFAGVFWFSSLIKKYMEHTVCIFTEKHVHIRKFLRKDKYVTYEEIGECIKKRKIRIQNGGLKIPYKGGSIHVTAISSGIPQEIIALLEEKYGISLSGDNLNAWIRRSGIGWSFVNVMGLMAIVFGSYLGCMVFLAEGQFTAEYAIYCLLNFLTFLGLCFMLGGLVANLLLYFPIWYHFRSYKMHVKVSFRTVLMSLLMMGIVYMGVVKSFGYMIDSSLAPKKETESQTVESPIGQNVTERFCQDVFGKEYSEVSPEELAGVKYFKIYCDGRGLNKIQYSFHDYEGYLGDEEFEKTVQTWTEDMSSYTPDYPIDFTMFTGLTYLDLTQCDASYTVFSKECRISRIHALETPGMLVEMINPQYVKVLNCHCNENMDESITGIEKYSELEDFSYTNSKNWLADATDISNLEYCRNLKKLYLECGKTYKGLEALENITGLKSVYINNCTLNECTFLMNAPQLEELQVGVTNQKEMEMLAQLSDLQVLKIYLDPMTYENVIDISCLANLKNLRELELELDWIGSATGVEAILKLSKLKTLSFSGRQHHTFDLFINSERMENNSSIETISLLDSYVWDSNTEERAEEKLKEHCLNLVNFSQEETE